MFNTHLFKKLRVIKKNSYKERRLYLFVSNKFNKKNIKIT